MLIMHLWENTQNRLPSVFQQLNQSRLFIHDFILSLSYLCIYLPPERQRISDKRIGTCHPARSYRNCSETEYSAQNTLFDVQTLAFCQYQINRSAADYTCFEYYPLVGYGIRRAYFNQ